MVEDDVLIRALLADELRDHGVVVVEAQTADEAMAYLDAGHAVDLIFSDVRMPGSLNGIDFAEQIRNQQPSLPIILSSAFPGVDSIRDIGPFLRKPYQIAEAIRLIFKLLGLASPI
ncbi:MAG TPA: response regulator [Rhodopila sp.]|nr:response regulator [Rhodopila sp.]